MVSGGCRNPQDVGILTFQVFFPMFNISQQRMHILLYLSPSNSLYRWENRGCQREITLTRDKNGEGNRGHERPKPYLCSLQTSSFSDLLSVVVGVRGSCFHCFKVPVTLVCQSPKWNDLSKFLMYVTLRLHLLFWKSRQLPHALFSAVMKAFFSNGEMDGNPFSQRLCTIRLDLTGAPSSVPSGGLSVRDSRLDQRPTYVPNRWMSLAPQIVNTPVPKLLFIYYQPIRKGLLLP